MFDLNDFDETHPGLAEWDVKRLAASVAVAGRGNALRPAEVRAAALAAVAGYRRLVRVLADEGGLAVRYARAHRRELAWRPSSRRGRSVGSCWSRRGPAPSAQRLAPQPEHADGAPGHRRHTFSAYQAGSYIPGTGPKLGPGT